MAAGRSMDEPIQFIPVDQGADGMDADGRSSLSPDGGADAAAGGGAMGGTVGGWGQSPSLMPARVASADELARAKESATTELIAKCARTMRRASARPCEAGMPLDMAGAVLSRLSSAQHPISSKLNIFFPNKMLVQFDR